MSNETPRAIGKPRIPRGEPVKPLPVHVDLEELDARMTHLSAQITEATHAALSIEAAAASGRVELEGVRAFHTSLNALRTTLDADPELMTVDVVMIDVRVIAHTAGRILCTYPDFALDDSLVSDVFALSIVSQATEAASAVHGILEKRARQERAYTVIGTDEDRWFYREMRGEVPEGVVVMDGLTLTELYAAMEERNIMLGTQKEVAEAFACIHEDELIALATADPGDAWLMRILTIEGFTNPPKQIREFQQRVLYVDTTRRVVYVDVASNTNIAEIRSALEQSGFHIQEWPDVDSPVQVASQVKDALPRIEQLLKK